jgi:hypothetical protein
MESKPLLQPQVANGLQRLQITREMEVTTEVLSETAPELCMDPEVHTTIRFSWRTVIRRPAIVYSLEDCQICVCWRASAVRGNFKLVPNSPRTGPGFDTLTIHGQPHRIYPQLLSRPVK